MKELTPFEAFEMEGGASTKLVCNGQGKLVHIKPSNGDPFVTDGVIQDDKGDYLWHIKQPREKG